MKNLYIVLAIVVIAIAAWFIFGNSSSTETATDSQESTSESFDEPMTLTEAQDTLGMECIGSDVSMKCQWNSVEYDFFIPADWSDDQAKRMQACEQGYTNNGYNMVTDGKTWHATTNFEKDNAALADAFNRIGFASQVVSYCR